MARIVMTTFGSSGDLNPFIAIGLGLRARGHDIMYAVEDIFRGPLEAFGFSVSRLTGDSEAALAPYQRRMFGKTTPFTSLRYIVTYYIVPTMRPKIVELRAGVPTLVVPWGADQFYNGAQLQRTKAGRWMQRRVYTAASAARALDFLLHDPSYRRNAQSLAAKIAAEDGVAGVCAGVDTVLNVACTPTSHSSVGRATT